MRTVHNPHASSTEDVSDGYTSGPTLGSQQSPSEPERENEHHTARFYWAFATLFLVTYVIALDGTIISVALPTITKDIGASALQGYWCGTSFLLASTVVQPPVTSISQLFGRKPLLFSSLSIFTAGCIIAALAKHITQMLIGRTLQGLGSGGILALTYVIVADLTTLRERGKWYGIVSFSWALGSVSGPLIGGALVDVSWPWLFWINLPFCGMAFTAVLFILKLKGKEGSLRSKALHVDWLGTFLFMTALTGLLIPLSWGGVQFPWKSAKVIGPLASATVVMLLFSWWTVMAPRHGIDPIIRPSMLCSGTALSAYVATVLHGIVIWGYVYYIPLYHEIKGASPFEAGRNCLPFTVACAPMAMATGLMITKTGIYRSVVWVGWVILATGSGLIIMLDRETATWKWILYCLIAGIGLGILYSSQAFAAQAAATDENLPLAAGFYAFCRSLGQTFGVVIGGVTFQNQFRDRLESSPEITKGIDELVKDASALVEIIKEGRPDIKPVEGVIIDAFIGSLGVVWKVLCAICGIALIITVVGIRHKSLDRKNSEEFGIQRSRDEAGEGLRRATTSLEKGIKPR